MGMKLVICIGEEHRSRASENTVLQDARKNISGGGLQERWRKLRVEEVHNSYCIKYF
jgi:hypothetical protein